jgi:transcriptional regulator with XRE-family HTH domain
MGFGAYIERLREGHGYSQVDLAAELSTYLGRSVDTTTLWRWESGKRMPRSEALLALMDLLKARQEDIIALLRNKKATAEDGRAAAERCLSPQSEALIVPYMENDKGITELLEAVQEYRDDQRRIGEVIGFAKSLRSTGRALRGLGARYKRPSRRKPAA